MTFDIKLREIASVLVFVVETVFPLLFQNTKMSGECGEIFEGIGTFPEPEKTCFQGKGITSSTFIREPVGTASNSQ